MATGQLKPRGWKELTQSYPDPDVIISILGICDFGARIGYVGHRTAATIHSNLETAHSEPHLVTEDIAKELRKGRLELYSSAESLPVHYTASPLGLTDKADGSKRRIHHLSYPPSDPTSINGGIPEHFGAITYSTIHDAIQAIHKYGKDCQLVKRDFESAFRHIPVSPLDILLLGFHWNHNYYAERFLPFGLRTAPYLFNFFAEVFHWILCEEFRKNGLTAEVIHYLDDFLIVIPPTQNPTTHASIFATLCRTVGLSIKEAKNEEGKVASFGGVELDTKAMVVRLPMKKLEKARWIVHTAAQMSSLSLHDLQRITGYLNFVAIVVPLGRTFLRRLYNMELYFPTEGRNRRRRLSREAVRDIRWWSQLLSSPPERSILTRQREQVLTWSDASSTRGLGGFYLRSNDSYPEPGSAFSIPLPRHLSRSREHINTQEMRAVEQVLLYWGST